MDTYNSKILFEGKTEENQFKSMNFMFDTFLPEMFKEI